MVEKASRLKITVLRRFAPEEIFDKPPVKGELPTACGIYADGQVFYVEENRAMPEGFCSWAWDDITKDITTL